MSSAITLNCLKFTEVRYFWRGSVKGGIIGFGLSRNGMLKLLEFMIGACLKV